MLIIKTKFMMKFVAAMLVFAVSIFCCGGTVNAYNAPQEEKTVYLTFDDGPHGIFTPQILDTLKQNNIKASFFVVGTCSEENPEVLKRIYKEGHTIGVHCYRHIYKEVYKDVHSFKNDLNKCISVISNILPAWKKQHYRFPGGSYRIKEKYINAVKSFNLEIVDWNCITGDTDVIKPSAAEVIETVKSTAHSRKKVIVLMHDNKRITSSTLQSVITYFKNEGYVFKKL